MPALLEWSPQLSLNLPVVDEQHEGIIFQLNELHEAIEKRAPRAIQVKLRNVLLELLREHFASEERLMRVSRCSGLEQHRGEHERLMRAATQLPLSVLTTNYIRFWLTEHLKTCDRAMVRELNGICS